MVMLDLTKAFDTVCHKRLLLKFGHYGIRGIAYKSPTILSIKEISVCILS